MPISAPRVCSCGKVHAHGTRCPLRAKADAERKARHDQTRPNAAGRGYGGKWQAARKDFLKAHPKCTFCGAPSAVVDHITPHRGDLKLFWQRSNWQALCTPCHSGRKQAQEKRA